MSDKIIPSIELESAPKIEQIELLECLGRGGMSVVYKARQILLDRIVAVKVISRSILDERSLRRLQQEAQLTGSLNHPNIANTMGFGFSQDEQPYLIMEYLEGITLDDEFKSASPMKFSRFAQIFLPVLQALECAHQAGLVHRDIKPSNIMICKTDDGQEVVKLMDFGIARSVDDEDRQKLTQTGAILGSPAYMSPEQCMNKALDARSDLYSLSCVMYEALCAQPPFTGSSALDLMQQHASSKLPSTAELCRQMELPPAIASVLLRGLSKNPDKRFQSAGEYLEALKKRLNEITLDRAPRAKESIASNQKLLVLSILLLVPLSIGAFALFHSSTSSEKKTPEEELHLRKGDTDSVSKLLKIASDKEKLLDYYGAVANLEKAIAQLEHSGGHKDQKLNALVMISRNYMGIAQRHDKEKRKEYFRKALAYCERGLTESTSFADKFYCTSLVQYKTEILSELGPVSEFDDYCLTTMEKLPSYGVSLWETVQTRNGVCIFLLNRNALKVAEKLLKGTETILAQNPELGRSDGGRYVFRALKAIYVRKARSVEEGYKLAIETADDLRNDRTVKAEARIDVLRLLEPCFVEHASIACELLNKEIEQNRDIYDSHPGFVGRGYFNIAVSQNGLSLDDRIKIYERALSEIKSSMPSDDTSPPFEYRIILTNLANCYAMKKDMKNAAKYQAEFHQHFRQ